MTPIASEDRRRTVVDPDTAVGPTSGAALVLSVGLTDMAHVVTARMSPAAQARLPDRRIGAQREDHASAVAGDAGLVQRHRSPWRAAVGAPRQLRRGSARFRPPPGGAERDLRRRTRSERPGMIIGGSVGPASVSPSVLRLDMPAFAELGSSVNSTPS